jgi:hypothetical protein
MKFPALRQIFSRVTEPRSRQSAPPARADTPVQEPALQAAPRRAREASAGSRPRVPLLARLRRGADATPPSSSAPEQRTESPTRQGAGAPSRLVHFFKKNRPVEAGTSSQRESRPEVSEPVVPGPSHTRDPDAPSMPAFANLPVETWLAVARNLPDGSFASLGRGNRTFHRVFQPDMAVRQLHAQPLSTDGIPSVQVLRQLLALVPHGSVEERDLLLIAGSRLGRIDRDQRQAARQALIAAIGAYAQHANALPNGLRWLLLRLQRDINPATEESALDSLAENLERIRHVSEEHRATLYHAVVRDLGILAEPVRAQTEQRLRALVDLQPGTGPAFEDVVLLVGRTAEDAAAHGARPQSVQEFYRILPNAADRPRPRQGGPSA